MAEKMGNVWVFIEHESGKIADVSLELVSKARELADQLGLKVEALLLGDENVEKFVPTLYSYGCDTVFMACDRALCVGNPGGTDRPGRRTRRCCFA